MDVCNYCNSSRFFTQEKPPHVGVYCQDCSRWIRWIPKGGTAAPQRKAPPTGQCACWDEIKKINRETTIVLRAVLSMGTLRGKIRPEIHIKDELVNELVSNLVRDEAAR